MGANEPTNDVALELKENEEKDSDMALVDTVDTKEEESVEISDEAKSENCVKAGDSFEKMEAAIVTTAKATKKKQKETEKKAKVKEPELSAIEKKLKRFYKVKDRRE